MKICFVCHSAGNGGAERVFLETIELLHAQGIECRVLLPSTGPFCRELAGLGIPYSVISYPMWMARGQVPIAIRIKAALNLAKDTLLVAWKILRWRSDVVYSNTSTVCVGALAARLTGLTHVWHLEEFGFEDQGLSFLFGETRSMALINNLSSRCICLSFALAEKYLQYVEPSKMSIIYPSMHRALESGRISGSVELPNAPRVAKFRCVLVGALIEGKGQRDALLAIAHLKKAGKSVDLLIVGRGDAHYRRSLEQLVQDNDLENDVVFVEHVSDSLPVMRSSDTVLICSKSEAFGRVTIEGMFSGRPVIGARSAATAELIKDGVTGLLYQQGDPVDLAAKIERLYKNPGIASDLGRNACSWVEGYFTRERCTRELLAVFNSLSSPPENAMGPTPVA